MSDIKELFSGFLDCNDYAGRTNKYYVRAIDTLSQFYNSARPNETVDLWQVTDPAVFKQIAEVIKSNPDYTKQNNKGNRMYSRALDLYGDFIKYWKFFQSIPKEVYLPSHSSMSSQILLYGAPGTGKSHSIKDYVGTVKRNGEEVIRDDNNIRITFHPDTDYASFVGCYKPMQQEGHEENIVYEYQQEAFIDSYLEAWKSYLSDKAENFYLVIEEINRGNCAQIFGDMFQLLDRDEKGYSSYKVSTDRDLQRYLEKELKNEAFKNMPSDLKQGKWMQLPPNFCILATMNTSDQSLFPMDSAFKRRWEWRYVPIRTKDIRNIRIDIGGIEYSWADFVIQINDYIQKKTGSTAKQIGPWFAKADKKVNENDEKPTVISYENFRSKVLFFLFNDALRDYDDFGQMFEKEGEKREYPFLFENLFDDKVEDDGISNVEHFLGELKVAKYTDNAENQQEDNDDDGSNNDGVE